MNKQGERWSQVKTHNGNQLNVPSIINLFVVCFRLLTVLTMTVLVFFHYNGSIADIQTTELQKFQKRIPVEVKDSVPAQPKTSLSTFLQKQRCMKHINVSFLKVHKAGSTTVMNIFLRFAIQHGLNVVLPHKSTGFGFNYLGYGKTVTREKIVPLPANETYNILCNHVVYNKTAFRSIMPPDTKYIGILREPESQFRSAMLYYGFYNSLEKYNKEKNISVNGSMLTEFLKDPKQFKVGGTYYVHNKMSFDLGLPAEKFEDDLFIDSYLKELANDYEIMLIMEEFEESLVLMKRHLCWDMKDILYVPLNIKKAKVHVAFSEEDRKNLKVWNRADFKLYNLFKNVFSEKKSAQGADFGAEVEVFKTVRKQIEDFCNKLMEFPKDTPPIYFVRTSKFNNEFQVTKHDCNLMMESELHMMKRLINDAWVTYNSSLH